jgi:hypothetical protein
MNKHVDLAKNSAADVEARKAQLLRQGEFYRAGVMHAKAQVKHEASPATLFHAALDHATWALRSRVDGLLKPTGVSVASMMPYALSVLGIIRRRRLGKPALGVAVVLGGLGWYLQRRRNAQLQAL